MGKECFKDCSRLYNVNLSSSLKIIPNDTFNGCDTIDSITIPDSVTEIGSSAFWGCTKLRTVYLSDNLTTIGSRAFYNDINIYGIILPKSVSNIGAHAFDMLVDYRRTDGYRFEEITRPLPNILVYCYPNSFALRYARTNGLQVKNAEEF